MSRPTSTTPRLDLAHASAEEPPANFGQQAAKAAWVAPLGAIAIVLLSRGSGDSPMLILVLGCVCAALLLFGGGAGLTALFGAPRWGREHVVAPASVGLVLCVVAGFMASVRMTRASAPKPAVAKAVASPAPLASPVPSAAPAPAAAFASATPAAAREFSDAELAQQGRSAALTAGWVGAKVDRLAITLLTLPDDAPFVKDMFTGLASPPSAACFIFDNSAGKTSVKIDTAGALLTHLDGREEPLPDAAGVLKASHERSLENVFTPAFEIGPRMKVANKMLFLPRGIDMRDVRSIMIKVDDRPIEISGRYFTAEQKAALYKRRP